MKPITNSYLKLLAEAVGEWTGHSRYGKWFGSWMGTECSLNEKTGELEYRRIWFPPWRKRSTGWPQRDDKTVVKRFGKSTAVYLLPIIKALEKEFYAWDRPKEPDFRKSWEIAAEQFRAKHPDLPEKITQAFEWCCWWDDK